jgi:hypothetical protein
MMLNPMTGGFSHSAGLIQPKIPFFGPQIPHGNLPLNHGIGFLPPSNYDQPGGGTGSTAPGGKPNGPVPLESRGMQFVFAILGARGMGVALTAAALDILLMGSDGKNGLQFGSIVAFASSAGDAGASALGVPTIVGAYVPDTSYLDVSDFIASGLATGLMMYYFGQQGTQLYASAAMGAVAGGAGGKVGGLILSSLIKTL